MSLTTARSLPCPPEDDWIRTELATLSLPDARLVTRAQAILRLMSRYPTESIPTACHSAAEVKGTYRFFENPRVAAPAVLAPHLEQTRQRIAQEPMVLFVQDFSELNYSGKTVAEELGWIGDNKTRGVLIAPILALTPERLPLGLVSWDYWLRETPTNAEQTRKHRPIEEKETYHWLLGYRHVCALAATFPQTHCLYVADRGSDLYEIYHEYQQCDPSARADFLLRGCEHNRLLQPTDAAGSPQAKHLQDHLAQQPVVATYTFTLPATATRPKRKVTQEARMASVRLKPPYRQGVKLEPVDLQVIYLQEIHPPDGVEPLCWLLYTSLPLETADQVQTVLQYYFARWEIELFFKILKSGCGVEDLYLQTAPRLQTALMFYVILAWRIHRVRAG